MTRSLTNERGLFPQIRYFAQKESLITQAAEVLTKAVTGSVATPGALRTITGDEAATL